MPDAFTLKFQNKQGAWIVTCPDHPSFVLSHRSFDALLRLLPNELRLQLARNLA